MKEVIVYLQKSLKYYKQLFVLTRKQKEVLLSEDHKMLGEVLDEKGKVIKIIDSLDKNFNKLKGGGSPLPKRVIEDKMVSELSSKLKNVITYLTQVENESRNIMMKNKNHLKGRLGGLYKGKKVLNSYSSSQNKGVSKIINIKG